MPNPLFGRSLSPLEGIKHAFFTREGGVSQGLFCSLNTGLASGDERSLVFENRRIAAAHLGIKANQLVNCFQVHSAEVVEVTVDSQQVEARADGMVTKQPGIALGIFTADCAPILMADSKAGVIAAVHAGWKGALTGVVAAAVTLMIKLGADITRIAASIGPCLQQTSYEVKQDLVTKFECAASENTQFFQPSAQPGSHLFDLEGFLHKQLLQLGVELVSTVSLDTYTDSNRFFSARRAQHLKQTAYGRQLSMIVLND